MKKIAIKIAFLSLVLFVSVPIFTTQINISKMQEQSKELSGQIDYVSDKLDYAKDKLARIKSGDEEVLREYARDSLGYYDPNEEIIYNDITD